MITDKGQEKSGVSECLFLAGGRATDITKLTPAIMSSEIIVVLFKVNTCAVTIFCAEFG